MHVEIVAYTVADAETMFEQTGQQWAPDRESIYEQSGASDLSEFAGRACYQSWKRPNPDTASNDGYLANIIALRHLSVLEHGSVSVYATGVSRSLTHELVRHRHFSFSQLSQRYFEMHRDENANGPLFVVPPLFHEDGEAYQIMWNLWQQAIVAYETLLELAQDRLANGQGSAGSHTKQAREAARAVLPNMTPTAIVVTGNHRAWREFLEKRGGYHADAEIRQFAVAMYRLLSGLEPAMYQDFRAETLRNAGEIVVH